MNASLVAVILIAVGIGLLALFFVLWAVVRRTDISSVTIESRPEDLPLGSPPIQQPRYVPSPQARVPIQEIDLEAREKEMGELQSELEELRKEIEERMMQKTDTRIPAESPAQSSEPYDLPKNLPVSIPPPKEDLEPPANIPPPKPSPRVSDTIDFHIGSMPLGNKSPQESEPVENKEPPHDPFGDARPGSTKAYETTEPNTVANESEMPEAESPTNEESAPVNPPSQQPYSPPISQEKLAGWQGSSGQEIRQSPSKEAAPVAQKEEPVLLGVSSPPIVKPGDEFTARFAAYIKAVENAIEEKLQKLSPRSAFHSDMSRCRWQTGTKVKVKLYGNHINSGEEEFVWDGEQNLINFDVIVSSEANNVVTILKFDVSISDIVIAKLRVDLEISDRQSVQETKFTKTAPAYTAFASYASEDRLRVLDRVSEIRRNGVDVFLDCLSLYPGEAWKPALEREILSRELFLLFWSANAKESKWVDWEWRTALKNKGISGIDPHPLDPVSAASPPEELKALHFGDMIVDVRKTHEK